MNDALLAMAPSVRQRLISAFETGLLEFPCDEAGLRYALGSPPDLGAIAAGLDDLERQGLSTRACAAVLRTIETMEARRSRPDLVWSGPEVPGLYARDTRRVYEELLGSAADSVWMSSYVYFDGPRAFEVLAERMDLIEGLSVTLLLNIQRRRGETTSAEDLVRRYADRLWAHDWPGTRRPRVFYDPRALEPDGPAGVLHAKAVVADDESVFITSANLTAAAFDHNIELGLLLRDRALASTLVCHFQGLIDKGLLKMLPAA